MSVAAEFVWWEVKTGIVCWSCSGGTHWLAYVACDW